MTGPEVASASVSVLPTFKGGAKELERVMGPALDRAGVTGGQAYGTSFAAGLMSSSAVTKIVAAGGLGGLLFAGWDRLTAIDTAQAKLDAFGNSASEIQSIMKSANDAVIGTQFSLGEAATQAAAALGSGVEQGEALTKHLTRIADVAAATSAPLSDIGMVINQITAAERVYTQDANQLVARGIPVWKLIADAYKTTSAEARKLVEEGKVDARTFFNALDGYIGGTAKNMDSFQSNLANLRATLGRNVAGLLGGDLDGPKEVLKEITEVLKSAEPVTALFGDGLSFVLSVVNAIPDPVKAAALAVIALNVAAKSTTFGRLQTSVVGTVSSFRLLRTEAMLAGATMPGVRVGLAGVASTARATGGALLGAFGGPVGLAITGAGVALGGIIALWQDGEAAAQRQRDAVDALSGSFDTNTGAITQNTIALLNDQLEDVLPLLEKAGVDYTGLTSAIAQGDPEGKLAKLRAELEGIIEAQKSTRQIGGVEVARAAIDALARLDQVTSSLTTARDTAARALKSVGDEAEKLPPKFDSVKAAVDSAFGSLNRLGAERVALRELAQSIADNGDVISATSAGGIANLDALQATIAAMADNAGDNYGVFVANVSGLMQYLQSQGVDTTSVMGAVRQAVANVAGTRFSVTFDNSQLITASNKAIAAMRAVLMAVMIANPTGETIGAFLAFNARVMSAAAAAAQLSSSFTGVSSSSKGASSGVGSVGKSAKDTAADLKALRQQVVGLAEDWLQPSRYSAGANSVMDQIRAAYREGAISKKTRNSLLATVKREDLRMQAIAKRREELAEQIDDATTALEDAINARSSFRDSIIQGFRDLGNITKFAAATEKTVTETFRQGDRLYSVSKVVKETASAKTMVDGLREQVAQARKFKDAFERLRKLGLNDASLQNLMTEFLSSGDASIAEGLAAGGKTAVSEVNDLMADLTDLTGTDQKGWAVNVAEDMFGAGVDAAEGFLKGLQSKDKDLEKQYDRIAEKLVDTIKKKMGIRSPSRVMGKLAEYTSQGWNDNLHLDPVTPGISVPGAGTSTYTGAGLADGTELWLMADGEPIRVIVERHAAGLARAKTASRRGGAR